MTSGLKNKTCFSVYLGLLLFLWNIICQFQLKEVEYATNASVCTCPARSIEDVMSADLCWLGAAKYSRVHFEENSKATVWAPKVVT